jgi:hypothetical protein
LGKCKYCASQIVVCQSHSRKVGIMVDLCCATSFSHSHRRSLLHSPKSHAIISSCVDPITGGRVSEIVKQQNKFGCSWCLPLSQEEDKFVDFCDTYKGFIKVPSAYETFFEKWESAKSKNPPSSADGKKKSNILLRALYSSFKGDLLKAFLGKITWSILLFFQSGTSYLISWISSRAKAKEKTSLLFLTVNLSSVERFFVAMVLLSIGIQQMGIYSSVLGCKVKPAITTAIFKKMIIRDSCDSKADIVGLVAVDVAKISEACLSSVFVVLYF